jgi:hypothetical protein
LAVRKAGALEKAGNLCSLWWGQEHCEGAELHSVVGHREGDMAACRRGEVGIVEQPSVAEGRRYGGKHLTPASVLLR